MSIGELRPDGDAPRYFGVYPAIVTDIVDPDSLGRIEVKFPWLGGRRRRRARLGDALHAVRGRRSGLRDPARRSTRRSWWRSRPATCGGRTSSARAGTARSRCRRRRPRPNNKRLLKTRAKSLLEFDDTDGAAKVTLSMESGHKLVLDDSAQEVKLTHSNGSVITFNAAGQIQIHGQRHGRDHRAARSTCTARRRSSTASINCTTLIASSGVVSPSYTPGAGNIW